MLCIIIMQSKNYRRHKMSAGAGDEFDVYDDVADDAYMGLDLCGRIFCCCAIYDIFIVLAFFLLLLLQQYVRMHNTCTLRYRYPTHSTIMLAFFFVLQAYVRMHNTCTLRYRYIPRIVRYIPRISSIYPTHSTIMLFFFSFLLQAHV